MEKLKVLIVDDDVMHRKALVEIVEATGMVSVVRASSNGALALEWLGHNEADAVLLDAVILGDSSLDILMTIKKEHTADVIMVSDGKPGNVETTLEGLNCGALDFIQIYSAGDSEISREMIKNRLMILFSQIQIKNSILNCAVPNPTGIPTQPASVPAAHEPGVEDIMVSSFDPRRWSQADLVLIAASTGGPAALEVVFSMFPSDFARPVLIVQHIPAEFTQALVESLNKKCPVIIKEASDGDSISSRGLLIAPGGVHMVVQQNSRGGEKIIRLENTPHVNGVKPAADVLFKSVARAYEGKNILAVILTGMGNDGMSGINEIKKNCNCYCIVQSEKTCVVYGMPRCVEEAGLADEVADLQDIAPRICEIISGRS